MSTETSGSNFGTFIHSVVPEGLHVDPYRSNVVPNANLQKSSFSLNDFKKHSIQQDNEDNLEMENEEVEEENENSGDEEVEENNENEESENDEFITPVDEDVASQESEPRIVNNFGTLISDVYHSSTYGLPLTHSPQSSRVQYMQEYYRRMIQLLESTNKFEPASEETLNNLRIVCFYNEYNIKDIFMSVDLCPICLEDYLTNCVTTVLPCGHRFHLCCIKKWLQVNHTCPICKLVI